MASNVIVPISSPASSHELAHFLSADGVGAGFVRHRDIWWNNDEFLGLVWDMVKAPRRDRALMKLLYIRHTVIDTELVVQCCTKRLRCKAQCGAFPDDDVRVSAMTFSQARLLFTGGKVLCDNVVILVDGTYLDTIDTEIAVGLMNQSIVPGSCVKVLGLYNEDWDDEAAEKAVPLFSPLFRDVGVQKLSVSFGRASTMENDPEPSVVDKDGLVSAMVNCINQGKHIAFFLPRVALQEVFHQIEASPAIREDVVPRLISLRSNTSMSTRFDTTFEVGQIFHNEGFLISPQRRDRVQVCSVIVALDPEAGFATMPVKRVGLVVYSHMTDFGRHVVFHRGAGVEVCFDLAKRLSPAMELAQRQACHGITAKRVWLASSGAAGEATQPLDHSREFVFELVRGWPGRSMAQIPLALHKREPNLLRRSLRHLAVAGIIGPCENGYMLSGAKGAEMTELLPVAETHRLSFELTTLLASVRHCVTHPKSKRLLIRLVVLGGLVDDFLSEVSPVLDEKLDVSWNWMEEARRHTAGPAQGQVATGRLWFALGIWEKMRADTRNFNVGMARGDGGAAPDDGCHRIQGIGAFDRDVAAEIYRRVLDLENRFGLPWLAPSDHEWERPTSVAELHDVQVQLMLAFISNLAVWDLETDRITLLSSGHKIFLDPSSLVAYPRTTKDQRRPEKAYLIVAHRIKQYGNHRLVAESASCIGISLLRVTSEILGEPLVDWMKWP